MSVAETPSLSASGISLHTTAPAVTDYARALRTIGQDLTELFPKILVIDTDGGNFEAHGESHVNPFHRVRESTLKRVWTRLFGKVTDMTAPDPAVNTFRRVYSAESLEQLNQLHSANRSGVQRKPDNYSLAERLRTMGGIVNSRKGRLKQLRKDADQFFAEYWDQDGKLRTAKLTTVILYRNHQRHDSQSDSCAPRELWEGYDF